MEHLRIAKVLPALLKDRRIKLRELSEASGVALSTLHEWQCNRKPRDPVQVRKVAEALGVTLHYLLFGEDDNQEPLQRILKENLFSGTYQITIKKVTLPE